jgi:hypothetical protein
MPDLFISPIYFIIPAIFESSKSVWVPSWSARSLMRRHVLCDIFLSIHGVKEAKALVMAA